MKLRECSLLVLLLCFVVVLSGCQTTLNVTDETSSVVSSLEKVPAYSGSPYVEINGNQPDFPKTRRPQNPLKAIVSLTAWGVVVRHLPASGKI